MKDIIWLIGNTLRVTFKNKKNIIMYLFVPLIGIFISFLAYGGTQNINVNVGIVNDDPSNITNDTIGFIDGLDHVQISNISYESGKDKLTSGALDCLIKFDAGFSKSVEEGNPSHIEIASIKGAAITGFVKSYLYNYIDNIAAIGKVANGDKSTFDQMYKNYQKAEIKLTTKTLADTSKNKYMTLQTIGFLIMIMLMSAGNLSEIVLKEKQNRTYFRLLSTPINAKKYIFSNIVVNMIVMIIQIIITLTCMQQVFHIDINIPFWEATVVMMLFALIAIGISLITVAFTNSTAASGALQNLIVMPTVMLSGCFWPVEIMPDTLQRIAKFLPQRWTLDTLAKLQEGSSFGSLYLNFMILLAFALFFFLIAIYKFGRNNSARNFI